MLENLEKNTHKIGNLRKSVLHLDITNKQQRHEKPREGVALDLKVMTCGMSCFLKVWVDKIM